LYNTSATTAYVSGIRAPCFAPANAKQAAFPVDPGGAMPPLVGCKKQDYTVLIVIGVAVEECR